MVRDIKNNQQEIPVNELSFRPSVYGVCVKDGHVLLSPQWDGYDFPGGGLDLGESLEEGFVREIKEETGLDAIMGSVIHTTTDFFTHPYSGEHLHTILIFMNTISVSGEINTDGFDVNEQDYAKEAQWIPLEKIERIKFYNPIDSVSLIKRVAQTQEHKKETLTVSCRIKPKRTTRHGFPATQGIYQHMHTMYRFWINRIRPCCSPKQQISKHCHNWGRNRGYGISSGLYAPGNPVYTVRT